MSVFIENEYKYEIGFDADEVIRKVIDESVDFMKCPYECEVNVTITGNDEIRQINREMRNIDKPTDVLSFPMIEFETPGNYDFLEQDFSCFDPDNGELLLGDIVISYDRVVSQAKDYGHSKERELAFLTAHSMMHLFGMDHVDDKERKIMEKNQERILVNLGFTREKL